MFNYRNATVILAAVITMIFAATAVFAQATTPKLSGYVKANFGYTPSDNGDESEFKVGNARIKFNGKVNDKTDYVVFVDTMRDDVLLDAFMNHKITSSLSVKAGQFKTPYGTDNLKSAAKTAFVNRPYLKSDASPTFRDKGVQVTYKISKFDLHAAVLNGSGQNKDETNNNKSTACRVVAHVLPQLQLSGNYSTGKKFAAGTDREEYINVGATGSTGPWEYAGEFAQKSHGDVTGNAYFAYVAYDVETPLDYVPVLTPAIRYESSDKDTDIDDNAESRITIGVTAHLAMKYSDRVMLNYEMRDAETGEPDDTLVIEYQIMF